MRIVLILFSAVLLIAFADAQRKSNITKPVVNLEKRPRLPVWKRPPEERRKLSIFPKNNMKFVVTPKTVVKNDDTANEGLPTKRPLVRRFTMQDRNDKGTWSFPLRKPLMKTNRFTVTLAPPKSNRKGIDEMESEESRKVNTVIRHANIEQPSIKNHNLNRGNLIDTIQIQKMNPQPSTNIKKIENKLIGDEISEITKLNDSQNIDNIPINDNFRSKSDKVSKDYAIDIRSLDDEVIILNANETKNESKKDHGSIKFKQAPTLDSELSKNLLESRALDLNELKYAIEKNENNALTMDNEESNNYNTAQILSFNDVEILLEKIVNETKSSAAEYNGNSLSNSVRTETQGTLEDIPKFDVIKPNQFYDVITLSSDEAKITNFKQNFVAGSILHGAQIIENSKNTSVSVTNILNGEEDFTENVSDSLVVGNLESLINLMGKETAGVEKNHQKNIAHDAKEMKTYTKYTITEKPLKNTTRNDEIISSVMNDTVYETHTEFPKELNSNDTDSFNSKEILLEMYESNMSLSSEEITANVVDEIPNENVNLSGLEILNEPFIDSASVDEISNKSISNTPNNYTKEYFVDTLTSEEISNESSSIMAGEELSNESSSLIEEISNEASNNYTGEKNSNESSSNMAGEEISNESDPDKLNNMTEEISNEYTVETSDNFTGEVISNESSSNMAGEEISNESYPDKSNNLTEEISNEATVETSDNFTEEVISNESSSNMVGEEISNESYPDKSNNLTDEISNEATVETSDHFIEEVISNESSSNVAGEVIPNESNKSNNLTEEISNEATVETSDNFIEEVISNESSSNVAGEVIPNKSDKSNNSAEEISCEPTVEASHSFIDVEISEGSLIDDSNILIDVKISDKSIESSQELEISEGALTNRFKRSNNIIEEENLPTTVSGFKYTGNEITLNHELSYKNINA